MIIALLHVVATEKPPVACVKAIDCDDDGKIAISDVIALIRALLVPGSPPPRPPFPECGMDTTDDDLTCGESTVACQ